MGIQKEQLNQLKEQIINQISTELPEKQRNSMIEQINSMNEKQFIEFLKENNLINSSEKADISEERDSDETPFRLIAEGKIPSYKIDENKEAIAVLEINPISKSHTIIIPKKALKKPEKVSKTILTLANRVSKKIKVKFNPNEVLISSTEAFGEIIINVLPVYDKESLNSPRKKAQPEELEELKKLLERKSNAKIQKKPKIKKIESKKLWIPRRIP